MQVLPSFGHWFLLTGLDLAPLDLLHELGLDSSQSDDQCETLAKREAQLREG